MKDGNLLLGNTIKANNTENEMKYIFLYLYQKKPKNIKRKKKNQETNNNITHKS